MALRVALFHRTAYRYNQAVQLSPHVIRLRPSPHARTPILSYALHVEPKEHFINWQQDMQGNYQARLVFNESSREFSVTVDLVAELEPINPFDFFIDAAAETFPFVYDPKTKQELKPYLKKFRRGKLVKQVTETLAQQPNKTIDFLVGVNSHINKLVRYVVRMEPGIQTPERTLRLGSGSCRDSAWLQVAVLRQLGIAARFVSGYLIQLVADEEPVTGPRGPAADFTDLHAWCEAYVPGAGWIGLDATSGMLTSEGHIPVSCAADPSNAAPIAGSFKLLNSDKELDSEFEFEMRVQRIFESPRPSKPYRDSVWTIIDQSGQAVDHKLNAHGLELTMGGEPTFIANDDMDGEEWNTAAMGPTKRRYAESLLHRMTARFAGQGAVLHHGQGKWYPGEPLPRWALSCYWRPDGQAVWKDQRLLAAGVGPGHYQPEDAERLICAIAAHLSLDDQHVMAAYEDPWYLAWQEKRFPVDLDPTKLDLSKEPMRAHLYRQFTRAPEEPVGYVLPLASASDNGTAWETGPWFLRDETCFLIPGDSPLGYRLPLDSLPVASTKYDTEVERDPLTPRQALPEDIEPPAQFADDDPFVGWMRAARVGAGQDPSDDIQHQQQQQQQRDRRRNRDGSRSGTQAAEQPVVVYDGRRVVRTALSVEVRDGQVFIFMPPIQTLEAWLVLISAIEHSAALCDVPVVIEGYHPPRDPRLQVFQVTPDPGVIEVNVHPCHSWNEMRDLAEGLYEDARQCGLGTEKYYVNGRIGGTGGGSHITLGGAEPSRSPFLKNPQLLRSLITFWINHPCLSYLFSGPFIGATSQAPRVDESRLEYVSELELALKEIDALCDQGHIFPWQVDRILRHILVDVTGNTHRTEMCIDKLFSPDSASGRLGIVELRGFEMPPHPQLAMSQALLVRSLIACFADQPYRAPLARWGHELHDRFLLPTFVQRDLEDVCQFIRNHGIEIQAEWFAPHTEFRFPHIGGIEHDGMKLDLRHAIEPWPTLGEEPAGGGTTRFVDNSMDRLEITVQHLQPGFGVACNGIRLPLNPTGVAGRQACGVRFRTWAPDHCLHPTILPHEPLVFDIVDERNQRAVAGCTYWSTHPGGRNPEERPINNNEAAGRRNARFAKQGHTPGALTITPWQVLPEQPLTLDLRHVH